MLVNQSQRFSDEIRQLFGNNGQSIVEGLEWTLRRMAPLGQRVRNTNLQVWPLYPGDGFAYVVYYSVSDTAITLQSIFKRQTPVSAHFFDLEED